MLGGPALREGNKLGWDGASVYHGAAAAAARPWELESAVIVITANFKLPGRTVHNESALVSGFAAARLPVRALLPPHDAAGRHTPVSAQSTREALRCLTVVGYVHWTAQAAWINAHERAVPLCSTGDELCRDAAPPRATTG